MMIPTIRLVRDFYETLAAYEQLLTEKNGRNTPATRTQQKLANKGVYLSLIEWTRGKIETNGFTLLVEAGLPEYTGSTLSPAMPIASHVTFCGWLKNGSKSMTCRSRTNDHPWHFVRSASSSKARLGGSARCSILRSLMGIRSKGG
jgi:hypothetical protein